LVDPALINSAQSVAIGTAYKDSPIWMDRSSVAQGYGDYILSDVTPGDSQMSFWYLPNLTEEQKNTPYRETPSTGNHYWPPILVGIRTDKSSFPRTANAGNIIYKGDSYEVTPIFYPSADTGTRFVLREYFSPTKFDIPQWDTPLTAQVSFPVPGSRPFSFPECLHPDIPVPDFFNGVSQYAPSTGVVLNQIGIFKRWFFPATNFKTWESFILYDRQSLESGGWHRTQMEVFPPALPRRQIGF
jgi:hypothetical protein